MFQKLPTWESGRARRHVAKGDAAPCRPARAACDPLLSSGSRQSLASFHVTPSAVSPVSGSPPPGPDLDSPRPALVDLACCLSSKRGTAGPETGGQARSGRCRRSLPVLPAVSCGRCPGLLRREGFETPLKAECAQPGSDAGRRVLWSSWGPDAAGAAHTRGPPTRT